MADFQKSEDLKKEHSVYKQYIDAWNFFIRSYRGGKQYKDGNYLLKHPFESDATYTRRKEIAYFYNFCRPVIDIFSSQLYRKKIQRDFGSLTNDDLFESFLMDADLEGQEYTNFIQDVQRLASIYGAVHVLVDKPAMDTLTRADAIDNDIRPYCNIVIPESLVDWEWLKLPTGRKILSMVKIKESETTYIVWELDRWERWQLPKKDGDKPKIIASNEHNLGLIPLVTVYNRREAGMNMVGLSDINDIADINKNIYYLCSDAKEIIENSAFPMLAMPKQGTATEGEDLAVGSNSIINFNKDDGEPFFLEPPSGSLTEIREWIRQNISEIHRIAKMGGTQATEDSSAPKSGIALEIESQQQQAVLSEKGDNLEEAENNILILWALWEGREFDGAIEYPDDFSVRDTTRDLDNALKSMAQGINSKTFKEELDKKTVRGLLPKADDETLKTIDSEIEADLVGIETGIEELGVTVETEETT